jgi:hypothetical protein
MNLLKHPAVPLALLGVLVGEVFIGAASAHADSAYVQLGAAPRMESAEPIEQAATVPWAAQSITIDPQNRNQVAGAYQSIYLPQASVPIGWNGNVASCTAGTTSAAYRQATIDRVNFYRALSGLPGNVALNGGVEASETQAAALMFSANHALSHDPPSSWTCWTSGGHDAAAHSNIAAGFGNNAAAGTGAIDLYMDDGGTGNEATGHRRWIQYPPQVQMDSGSIPYNPQWATNALWVLGPFGNRPATPNGVAWPSRGYIPWQLLPGDSNRWSFSWPNANFASATVSMKRNGQPLAAPSYESVQNGYGDNTLVWKPQGVTYTQPAADVTYHVTISGISGGGAPSTISYDVIAIDPYVLGDEIFKNGFD